jgi:AraC-like DNA-binding protein
MSNAGERELPDLCVRSQGLVIEAMHAAREPATSTAVDVIDAACRVLAEVVDGRIDLRGFCRREGLDYERFRKDFTRRMGQSPGQYRIRRRIERACTLLESGREQITAIASRLGYASPYEFSAQFRQWMGVSPQAYRGERISSASTLGWRA